MLEPQDEERAGPAAGDWPVEREQSEAKDLLRAVVSTHRAGPRL